MYTTIPAGNKRQLHKDDFYDLLGKRYICAAQNGNIILGKQIVKISQGKLLKV